MAEPNAAPAPEQTQGQPEGGKPVTATWRESFDDAEIKGSTSLDKFKGKDEREILGSVAKAYVNLEKMPRGVAVPKEGAPESEWDAFYEKIGRPKTADDYQIDLKVPEGVPWNKIAEKNILARAHKRGLTKSQAEGLLNDYLEIAQEGNTRLRADASREAEEAYDTIQKDWGGLTDRNLSLVSRAVSEFGGEEFKNYLDESGLGNDPRFLKFVHKMGTPMLEANLIKGEALGMKKAEAVAEIEKLMASKEWAAGDKAVLARINSLYPIAHGS
jgi:hypothetical protein